MPTPTKPFKVLTAEKKSHRTKAELKIREEAEKSLSTEKKIKERKEVKENKIAHKEFKRIEKLLENIDKNDAIYEAVINRYCLLQAECFDLEERREEFYNLIIELKIECKNITDNLEEIEEIARYKLEYAKSLANMTASMLACDKQVQSKRKMLLDIEKENIMTIASALRSIPKKAEEKENPLLKVLRGEA
ncbi:MAG: hypothetical protein HFJ47_00095 [Clostridia bacterium]|nr:hypothetical protein [Clostridia bacterium]